MSTHSTPSLAEKTIAWRDTSGAGTASTLPSDLLQSASKRLALLAVVMLALVGVYIVLNYVFQFGELANTADAVCYGLVFSMSACVYLLARSGWLSPQRMLDVGLVYEVAIASIGVVFRVIDPGPLQVPEGGASEVCIIILLFPVLAPNTPGKVFVASLLAASMDPLGVALAGWFGKEIPPWSTISKGYFWNFACVGLAVLASRVLYGLGREVSRAREMGAYRLTEPIGEGAMGKVWKAQHHLLARDAAIKIVQPDRLLVGDEEARSLLGRFEREAQATAALESPNTVELYDFGVTNEGTFFYVMELLDGLDLDSLVRRYGPQPSARVVHILGQTCHSLADAHARNLIHRDVKPANIFICRKGLDTDFVKVLDFGLVKTHTGVPEDARSTMQNTVLGTPSFMSPEVVRSRDDVDGRADLYSLGCVAYWLLTGVHVFEAPSAMDVMIQHVDNEPEPPSARSELEVDPDLERIVMQCLKKDRNDRPESAADLMRRLSGLAVAHDWTPERSRAWWDRHLPLAQAPMPAAAVGSTP